MRQMDLAYALEVESRDWKLSAGFPPAKYAWSLIFTHL